MDEIDDVTALRNELAELRSELNALKSRQAEASPPEESSRRPGVADLELPGTVSRRRWVKAAAAAAVGGTAVALGSARPVAAASNLQIGSTTNADALRTVASHTGASGTGVSFLFKTETSDSGSVARFPAAVGAFSRSANRPSGLFGLSYASTGPAYGVAGLGFSPQGAGVLGESDAPAGTGVRGIGGSAGNGVSAEGRNGVSAQGTDYGVIATGQQGAIFMPPTDPIAPPEARELGQPGRARHAADRRHARHVESVVLRQRARNLAQACR